MVLGKKVANFDWELGRNLAPREGQKIIWLMMCLFSTLKQSLTYQKLKKKLKKGKKSKRKARSRSNILKIYLMAQYLHF